MVFKKKSKRSYQVISATRVFQLDAILAGALVPKLANAVGSFVPNVAGAYQGNLVRGTIGWAAAKWGSGMIRSGGQKTLTAENYLVGGQLGSGILAGALGSVSATNTAPITYY